MKSAFSTIATILLVGWAAVTHADAPIAVAGFGQNDSQPASACSQTAFPGVGADSQPGPAPAASRAIAFGTTPAIAFACAADTLPEPACVLLLAVGSLLFLRRP